MIHTNPVDILIGKLYRSTSVVALEHFRQWALEQVREVLPFDAAVWSTGHLSTRTFHTNTLIDLPEDYLDKLLAQLPNNPISKALFNNVGRPVDMSDVIDDSDFYQSGIYQRLFLPHGIERILSSIHIDSRSGIYTLLTLYRRERAQPFTGSEKALQKQLLYHLLNSASHACIQHLNSAKNEQSAFVSAICDRHGIYHEVDPEFLDLIERQFPSHTFQRLPFSIGGNQRSQLLNGLLIQDNRLGDLYRVDIRKASPLDELTAREWQVVQGVTAGLSFKVIAKQLELSPSTISNHLYRIYQKLDINSRTELADLVQKSSGHTR